MSQSTQPALEHSDVREHLEKILAHRLFFRSARMVRFLRFAVEHCLSGRADDLKEYVIGVEVFDRSGDYDPRVDPIVRVEARRLRAKLKAYYESDGAADTVVIEFVSGSYAPRISHRRVSQETAPPAGEAAAITVVVLPFTDLSLKPGNEYFSDGLTEELIHVLTKVAGLRVVAWTTAERMRDRQQDLAAIREQLNASFVLTGSARIAGASLRVRAQLIDTTSGVYQWSETFDRRIHDVFAIQEEIARAIVRTLRLQLAPAGPLSRSPVAINSYDHYLKGRYYWHRRTPEDLERSVEYFRAALDLDAHSSLAQTGLADAYTLMVEYGLTHPVEGMTRAREAATRAIALDPESAEAHTSLALIRGLYDWQWEESESLFRRAIQLNPGYATAHHWLAVDCHAILGRLDEAVAGLEIARQLDPLSSIVREGQAFMKMMARDYEGAIASYRELIAADPDFYKGYTGLGRALALEGNYLDALRMLDQGRAMAGDIPNILAAMGQVYGLGGETDRARDMLGKLEGLARTAYVPSTAFAVVHLGLGEYERALDWLEKGLAVHDPPLTSLYAHPVYDPLRGHPRFDALLCALNLR